MTNKLLISNKNNNSNKIDQLRVELFNSILSKYAAHYNYPVSYLQEWSIHEIKNCITNMKSMLSDDHGDYKLTEEDYGQLASIYHEAGVLITGDEMRLSELQQEKWYYIDSSSWDFASNWTGIMVQGTKVFVNYFGQEFTSGFSFSFEYTPVALTEVWNYTFDEDPDNNFDVDCTLMNLNEISVMFYMMLADKETKYCRREDALYAASFYF